MADYNARFAKPPANKKDLHRPVRVGDDLEDAFAWKEERTLSQALTLQYDKVIFILEPSEQAKAAIGKRVTVIDHPDGRLSIRYNGVDLAYRTLAEKVTSVFGGHRTKPPLDGASGGPALNGLAAQTPKAFWTAKRFRPSGSATEQPSRTVPKGDHAVCLAQAGVF